MHEGADCAVTVVRCEFRGSATAAAAQRVLVGVYPDQMAVLAARCKKPVSVRDSVFRGHQRVIVIKGGSIALKGCTFESLVEGLHLRPVGSTVMQDCRSEERVAQGVSVSEGARAKISGCRFNGFREAISALQDTTISVVDTICTGASMGLSVKGAAVVRAQRLTFTGCNQAFAAETGHVQRTVVTLLDCVATGAQLTAVALQSPGVEARMQGCTLVGNKLGLSVIMGASVRVADTCVADCGVAAMVGEPKCSLEGECSLCGRSGVAGRACAWRALYTAAPRGVEGAACAHEGAVAAATLEDVVMTDCIIGVQANVAGRVAARRVDVRGAQAAYTLAWIGAAHVFRDCAASGGTQPAVLSRRIRGPELGYALEPEGVSGIVVRGGPPARANAFDLKV